jgi:hypothetical protein
VRVNVTHSEAERENTIPGWWAIIENAPWILSVSKAPFSLFYKSNVYLADRGGLREYQRIWFDTSSSNLIVIYPPYRSDLPESKNGGNGAPKADDFRTFLGDFMSSLPQFDLHPELNL